MTSQNSAAGQTAVSEPRAPQPAARSAGVLPQLLRLAGLAALFGTRGRRSRSAAELPADDPYLAYLRWSAGASSARTAGGSASALDDRETAPA